MSVLIQWLREWWVTLTLPSDIKKQLRQPLNGDDFGEVERPDEQ